LFGIEVLAEDDGDAVRVANAEVANTVGSISWLDRYLRSSLFNLFVAGVNVANPLEQVHAVGTTIALHKVDRGVITPHNGIIIISKVGNETQNLAVVTNGRSGVWNMQHGCALNELRGI
jgi:hypothetical protein